MSARTDIEHQITIETAECVENEKKSKFLNGFFNPRKQFEGGCEVTIRAKYAATLNQLSAEENSLQHIQEQAFVNKITGNGDGKLWMVIGVTFLFIIIVIWIL